MAHPLYGKKKKKMEKCPNPLFTQWLREWRDEAAEKGAKSQYTYGKALKTLQKFPLKVESGKDCKILENFGDKICKMLDDKLAKHVAEYGSAEPVETPESPSRRVQASKDSQKSRKRDKSAARAVPEPVGIIADYGRDMLQVPAPMRAQPGAAVRARAAAHELSDSDGDQEPQQPARKRQRSGRAAGEREYVPAYRSGPYAIMLTLYRNMQHEDSRGFMTKSELVRDAQPLADKSFSFPDPNSRYTSWSSMGTLVKKGLVIKDSSPAKYSLTDAGCELAHRLEAVARENAGRDDLCGAGPGMGPQLAPVAPRLPKLPSPPLPTIDLDRDAQPSPVRVSLNGSPLRMVSPPSPPSPPDMPDIDENYGLDYHLNTHEHSDTRLKYWYVQEDGSGTLVKDKAMVTIDEAIGVGFLIKCSYRELLQSGYTYKLDTSRPMGDDFVYVYLSNDNTQEIAMPPTGLIGKEKKKANAPPKGIKPATTTQNEIPDLPSLSPDKLEHSTVSSAIPGQKKASVVVIDSEESSLDSISSVGRAGSGSSVPSGRGRVDQGSSLMDRISSKVGSVAMPRTLSVDSQESSQASIQSLSSMSSACSTKTLPEPDFVMRPGEFDVVLCVDNAEFYGQSRGTSKNLLPDLIKNGVECQLRKLHVGDLLWIAKEKKAPVPGQLEQPQGRELVLNYIIERKRMDDLVGSCLDGRFKEQKFRLKKSGIQNAMYLIEDHGSMQHFSLPEATIKQAITNTQVIDGFQVKRTKDAKETVAFLTVFTRYLQSCFKQKTLFACGLDKLRDSNVTNSIYETEQRLPTFEEFNQSSVKSKALTVQEMFGKQLIQLHGMSAEKARAVIEKYPTPSTLFQAYDDCSDNRAREILLAGIKCGKSARSLGQAQSKQISQLYNTHIALS